MNFARFIAEVEVHSHHCEFARPVDCDVRRLVVPVGRPVCLIDVLSAADDLILKCFNSSLGPRRSRRGLIRRARVGIPVPFDDFLF